jgi:hypothetical protein
MIKTDIDQRIARIGGWRADMLTRVRNLIHAAAPQIVEELKWAKPTNPLGVPVWSQAGIVCTGEAYKQTVKLTFANGAALPDPSGLFNASLDGKVRRAIDLREGQTLDAKAFKVLIKAAVALNLQSAASKTHAKSGTAKKAPVKLLSGGNPQIAKADGDAPVQAYIAAMPGWKQDIGRQLDALIVRTVPRLRKAVKWNSPLYGVDGQGWFLSIHVYSHFVKVTFFNGASLTPLPPGGTPRSGASRWVDIRENDFDSEQMTRWVKQAAALPGWNP